MSSIKTVNPNADVIGKKHALTMNINAARGLQNALKTNLGPKGTMKMLVSGAGDVKITKDGKVLLDQMQLQHPTAAVVARTATAQDDIAGDGTSSTVLFVGELLHKAQAAINEGLHPRVMVEGIETARTETLAFLEKSKVKIKEENGDIPRDTLIQLARTSLRTKVPTELADHLTQIVVDAIKCIRVPGQGIDLHMVEQMHMRHKSALDTKLVDGLVLDHGARQPLMKKRCKKCYLLVCNISLEYEKSEVNAGFFYGDAAERHKLVAAERKFTDDKVRQVIAFRDLVCKKDENFIVINQKGIDPISLDLLQKAGIIGIRRAKRRNMERIAKACGGYAVNCLDDIKAECLGWCEDYYEHVLGDDKYTFIEGTKKATSCTILIKGPNDHTIRQIKDAIRDGLRAVKNVYDDLALIPGAGAFEMAAHIHLIRTFKPTVRGRAKLGIQAFADALLVIPKTLLQNSGLETQFCLMELLDEVAQGHPVGLDIETGKPIVPSKSGIWDNLKVKKQFLQLGSTIASKLLQVDEVIRAGKKMGSKIPQ